MRFETDQDEGTSIQGDGLVSGSRKRFDGEGGNSENRGRGVGWVGDAMNSDKTMHQHQHDHHHEEVDAWHDHSHDAVRPQQAHTEKVNGPLVIGVGSVLILLIVATVIVTYQYYNWYVTRLHDHRSRPAARCGPSSSRSRRDRSTTPTAASGRRSKNC